MAMEIVDVPINSMVIFHCYVSSPEGNIFQKTWRIETFLENTWNHTSQMKKKTMNHHQPTPILW